MPTSLMLWLLAPGAAWGQQAPEQITLAVGFDLDGGPADPDQVVDVTSLVDQTSFTVAGQPDVCRPIDLTIVDPNASITAGTITVVGVDCLGEPVTASFTFRGGGSGVVPLTVVSGNASGAYLASVSAVSSDVLTGEGAGDTLSVGYSAGAGLQYVLYGVRNDRWGRNGVDAFGSETQPSPVTTEGVRTVRLRAVESTRPFGVVSEGDLLRLTLGDIDIERKVVALVSNNEVDVDEALMVDAKGVGFRIKHPFVSSDPEDDLWIPMNRYSRAAFAVAQRAGASAGSTQVVVECRGQRTVIPAVSTTLSGVDAAVLTVDLERTRYNACRLGLAFDAGDDSDAEPDVIDVTFLGTPR